jgi:chlorite dismutase
MTDRPGPASAFVAGPLGAWRIDDIRAVIGDPLAATARLDVQVGAVSAVGAWTLRGVAGHARYTERHEKRALDPVSPLLGRAEASCAALIPIRKTPAWWALTQDERRAVFEHRSHHIAHSLPYLPRIARRLYHARDLGEPFDFLTWFEFAPEHAPAFDDLLATLRATEEWTYVDREVELRLSR